MTGGKPSIPLPDPTSALSHINWGLVGASVLLMVFGVALWKTTPGKVLIIAGIAVMVTMMMTRK